jgi:hypothetical protein
MDKKRAGPVPARHEMPNDPLAARLKACWR